MRAQGDERLCGHRSPRAREDAPRRGETTSHLRRKRNRIGMAIPEGAPRGAKVKKRMDKDMLEADARAARREGRAGARRAEKRRRHVLENEGFGFPRRPAVRPRAPRMSHTHTR